MKIADTQMQMSSAHTQAEKHVKHERLQYWVGEQRVDDADVSAMSPGREPLGQEQVERLVREDRFDLSAQARALAPKKALAVPKAETGTEVEEYGADLEISLIKALVEKFTGHKIELFRPQDFASSRAPEVPVEGNGAGAVEGEAAEGWGLVYDYYESYQESESVSFSAQGKVVTSDGKEISVDLSLSMSRDYYSEQQVNIRAGDALKDPLVINYSGTAAQLTQRSFSFDLDLDGRSDQIAFVRPGSGFLALDKNGDGTINDGGELFGPSTGSGFAELALHDGDGNGWIDEGDAIYDRLRIWSKDESGTDQLVGLGRAGVGAIYLGHQETPFMLKDADNQTLGQVRDTGLFLREDGSAGTVQEIDLVV
jgi:hypothetical protein